jgi:hypothetical protein
VIPPEELAEQEPWSDELVGALLLGVAAVSVAFGLAAHSPWLAIAAMLMFVPAGLVCIGIDSSGGSSEDDDSGGPGGDQPPTTPRDPTGGLPLPDADQAIRRVRDHAQTGFVPRKPRTGVRERERTPTPVARVSPAPSLSTVVRGSRGTRQSLRATAHSFTAKH